jgi:hypothetical protein
VGRGDGERHGIGVIERRVGEAVRTRETFGDAADAGDVVGAGEEICASGDVEEVQPASTRPTRIATILTLFTDGQRRTVRSGWVRRPRGTVGVVSAALAG